MISFKLDPDLELIQSTTRAFALDALRPALREAEVLGHAPATLRATYLELGLPLIDVPESFGGAGLGLIGRVVVEEALAEGDIGLAMAMPSPAPLTHALLLLATEAQQRAAFEAMTAQPARAQLLLSEPRAEPGRFSTVATRLAGGGYSLSGRKTEAMGGADAESLIVLAQLEATGERAGSPAVFHLAASMRGLVISPPSPVLGLGAAPPVSFTFEDVQLPESARLSGADARFEAAALELVLRLGLIGAARSVGLAQAAFDLSRVYASERRAFGKRIAEFQSIAFGFADAATELELMRGMVHRAAYAFDHQEKDAAKLAAMAVAECHEGAMSITDAAVQVLGGSGYVQDYPVEKWMRDARTHMAHALHKGTADLLVGRAALGGGRVLGLTEDGPMPELQTVIF